MGYTGFCQNCGHSVRKHHQINAEGEPQCLECECLELEPEYIVDAELVEILNKKNNEV